MAYTPMSIAASWHSIIWIRTDRCINPFSFAAFPAARVAEVLESIPAI